ncbi:MAG: Translation initiation factor 2 alpha subunit (SUI2) [Candidatus Methanohalarchaeum thermophilum]|uniref:Translation initiation factor 2 subunit alpha n=1 Tax=Methanohalarchaeum thermophilum TaxID=1903181 RepID=A0A1Q6DW64_METT1|nr:MAG: Translation initiation factor 2 alpha subunit (SUI2) [Candidatus Methanohalarchaeum thermophilum]
MTEAKTSEYPNEGELVVCTVTEVVDFGAFVELEEYDKKEGLIHISELASGWIKHVRDHVQEGQKVVCKVLEVQPEKEQINLSLKDVNQHQEKEKIQEWKNEQKAERWAEFVAEKLDKDKEAFYEEVGYDLTEEYDGLLYPAFEEAALSGKKPLLEKGVEEKWVKSLVEVANENVEIPYVEITGYLELRSYDSNGVKKIRETLEEASQVETNNSKVEISYVGSPHYRIHVRAPGYKEAEKTLSRVSEEAIESIEEKGGEGDFHREIKEGE